MSGSGNMQDNKKIQYEKAIEVKTKNTLVTQFCIYVMISCGVTLFLLQIMKWSMCYSYWSIHFQYQFKINYNMS